MFGSENRNAKKIVARRRVQVISRRRRLRRRYRFCRRSTMSFFIQRRIFILINFFFDMARVLSILRSVCTTRKNLTNTTFDVHSENTKFGFRFS